MTEKITSKNLSYSSSLPPFLARLHAEAGGATGPDPLLAAHKRSRKKRSSSEEAEDAPLVVDEHGNTVSLELEKDGTIKDNGGDVDENDTKGSLETAEKSEKRDTDGKASIGARKRKVGKVIGESANNADQDQDEKTKQEKDGGKSKVPVDKKVKKKAKKIKLSFDEDEG